MQTSANKDLLDTHQKWIDAQRYADRAIRKLLR
jgi:hypothetical protein